MTSQDLSPIEVRAAEAACVVNMQWALLEIIAADAGSVQAQVLTMSADAGSLVGALHSKINCMLRDMRGLAMNTILGEELAALARRGGARRADDLTPDEKRRRLDELTVERNDLLRRSVLETKASLKANEK